ncbi:DUF2946 family protein [Rhodoferax saidenbachensis]|uniref:DUF2946 domain-containing protein n=1 Tax=Rhodoferax saidenbachensis TaxID=1484693 RepID=A0ABU1ZMM9_9BURK|nr:DUF2946 family protein [Rhodoferax saidenbachensis]MDR7306814.1 hypothetical protein [Rhodoferax saidenbachensis]
MDDIVKQAMAKWPNVPHCYGWLGLDARGNWYMRDDGAQASGAFSSGRPGAKGSLLQHEKLIDFIQRNYAADTAGQWFFQNGPQRVYVELEATPWVWRVADSLEVAAHSGAPVQVLGALLDEHGWLYLRTALGLGLVHTQDMENAARALETGLWALEDVARVDLPGRFGYVTSPTAQHAGH